MPPKKSGVAPKKEPGAAKKTSSAAPKKRAYKPPETLPEKSGKEPPEAEDYEHSKHPGHRLFSESFTSKTYEPNGALYIACVYHWNGEHNFPPGTTRNFQAWQDKSEKNKATAKVWREVAAGFGLRPRGYQEMDARDCKRSEIILTPEIPYPVGFILKEKPEDIDNSGKSSKKRRATSTKKEPAAKKCKKAVKTDSDDEDDDSNVEDDDSNTKKGLGAHIKQETETDIKSEDEDNGEDDTLKGPDYMRIANLFTACKNNYIFEFFKYRVGFNKSILQKLSDTAAKNFKNKFKLDDNDISDLHRCIDFLDDMLAGYLEDEDPQLVKPDYSSQIRKENPEKIFKLLQKQLKTLPQKSSNSYDNSRVTACKCSINIISKVMNAEGVQDGATIDYTEAETPKTLSEGSILTVDEAGRIPFGSYAMGHVETAAKIVRDAGDLAVNLVDQAQSKKSDEQKKILELQEKFRQNMRSYKQKEFVLPQIPGHMEKSDRQQRAGSI